MAKPRLILRDLRHPGLPEGSFELNRSPIRIGRGPRCEIRLHSDRIADVQVILRQEADRWTLHPVGPSEGCEIHDGFLSESAHLDHGARFRIGHVEMMLALYPVSESRPVPEPELKRTPDPVVADPEPAIEAVAPPEPNTFITPEKVAEIPVEFEPEPQVASIAPSEPVFEAPIEPVAKPLGVAIEAQQSDTDTSESLRPAFAEGMNFPNHDLPASRKNAPPLGRSLKIGSLYSPASSAGLSAFSAITGAELSAPAMPVARSAIPATAATIASSRIEHVTPASPFGADIPRSDIRNASRTARPAAAPRDEFVAPIAPARTRPMPLRRYLRDHDSSTLCDSSQAAPRGSDTLGPPLSFDHTPVEPPEALAERPAEARSPKIPGKYTGMSKRVTPVLHSGSSAAPDIAAEQLAEAFSALEAVVVIPAAVASETAESVSTPPGIDATIQEFENWLDSVGPNLEPVESGECCKESAESAEESASRLTASENSIPDSERTEAGDIDDKAAETSAPKLVATIEAPACEKATVPFIDTQTATATLEQEPLCSEADADAEVEHETMRFDASRRGGIDMAVEESLRKPDIHEWPSAHDILRWSEDRHGRSFLLASSEDLKSLKVSPARTRPHEWMRMNFPTALALCVTWLGGAAVITSLGYRMSVQDELTQKSIGAMLAAEKTGASPRIDAPSMARLTKPAAWWEVPPMQRWFRAAFVRMREDKGQPLAVKSAEMAAEIAREAPLYPPARIWKSTNPETANVESGLEGLSLDALPLIMQADFDRRRGQESKANETDKIALKLVSDGRKPAKDEEIVYDAEFGTNRFLLPGQKRILAILKRLTKEPNAEATLQAVMPADSPLVWLTAAQLMRHAGVGDASDLATKAAQWSIPDKYSGERRQLIELAKAEANALLGKDELAIETYERLVKDMPESEWKRTLYLNLGILNLKSLKTEAAKLALKKARGEDPYHEIDRHAIATIRGLSNSKPESIRSATTVRAN